MSALLLLAVFVLVLLNGFFVAAEFALVRSRRGTLEPNRGSISFATAGSPRKPMPSEVSVIPSWQADR